MTIGGAEMRIEEFVGNGETDETPPDDEASARRRGGPASDEQLEGSVGAERSEERAKSSNSNTTEGRKPDRLLPRRDDSHADYRKLTDFLEIQLKEQGKPSREKPG